MLGIVRRVHGIRKLGGEEEWVVEDWGWVVHGEVLCRIRMALQLEDMHELG